MTYRILLKLALSVILPVWSSILGSTSKTEISPLIAILIFFICTTLPDIRP